MAETSLDSLDLVDSYSDDDDTNPNNIKNEEENKKATTTRLRIRLHATNLPRQGRRVRKRSPNAHVVVTSVVGGGGDAATTTTTNNNNSSSNTNKCWFETETVPHACHPQWTKTHVFEYEYGTQLFFYAHVFHLPSPADDESEMSSMPNISSSPKSLSEQGRNSSVGSTDSGGSSNGALFPAMRRNWKNKGRSKRSNEGGGEGEGGTSASRLENAVSLGTALFDVGDILGTVYHTKVKRLRAGGCVICRLENAANEFGTPALPTSTSSPSSSSEPLVFAFQLGMATKLVLPKEKRMSKWIKLFQSEPDTVLELSKQPSHQQQQQRRSHPSTPTADSQDGDTSSSTKKRTVRASSMPRTKQPWVTIWRSQPVLNSSQPTWDGARLDWSMLCSTSTSSDDDDDRDTTNNNNHNKTCAERYPEPLRISVRVLRPSGRRVEVAMAETTVGTLLDFFRTPKTSEERRLFLQSSSNFQPVGQVQILSAQLAPQSAITATNTTITPQPSSTQLVPAVSGYSDISSNTSPGYHQHHQRLFEPEASSTSLRTSSSGDLEIPDIVDLSALQPVAPPASFPAPSAAAAVCPPTTTKTFSQYVEQGTQIEFAVAIDFTSSNGDPRLPPSYHYQGNPDELNVYEETIMAIGKVLEQYSTTQQYPVWGFGAKYGGVVRHLFQCGPDPVVHGVNGILKAYQQVFASDLCMSGPTEFLSVLKMGAARAKRYHDQQSPPQHLRYMVLLIITDGVMDSFDETQRLLQVYSQMPVSFVFVGVGRASFDRMYRLCCPGGGVNHHHNNTTFVEFRLHQHNPLALGQAALASIPTQLCQYMQSRGF